jgi:Cu/Ag efflux protein CusF
MKRSIQVLAVIFVFSMMAFAHGKQQKFMGTVKEISANQIVITTTDGRIRNIETGPETKFLNGGQPAKASDLAIGERVVIEADEHGGKLIAEKVKFGRASSGHGH